MGIILFLWGAGGRSLGATVSKDGLLQIDSTLLLLFSEDLLGSERLLDLCLLGDVLVSLALFWDLGLLYLHLGLLDLDFLLLQHLLLVLLRARRDPLGLALFLRGCLCTGANWSDHLELFTGGGLHRYARVLGCWEDDLLWVTSG